jgi:hypothetical protein
MLKLLVLLALLAGGAAAAAYAPIHGRTVLDRWYGATDAVDFAERAWAEAKAALRSPEPPGRARGRSADRAGDRPAAAPGRPGRAPLPTETHTDADRAALDRIVAERAGR